MSKIEWWSCTVILFLCLVSVCTASPSVYLDSPSNGAGYLIPLSAEVTNIALEYQLFGIVDTQEYSQYELCFDVLSRRDGKKAVEQTCISCVHRQLLMRDLSAGEYVLSGVLQRSASNVVAPEVLESTRITNVFTVHSYEEASPRLLLQAVNSEAAEDPHIVLAANPTTSKADLSVQYTYTASLLDHAFFTTCASIEDAKHRQILPWTCLAAKDRQFTLNNLHLGSYTLSLMLKDIRLTGDASYVTHSKVQRAVEVKPFADVLPTLVIANPVQEYMLDEATNTAQQVEVQYQLLGSTSAIKQLVVCVEIHKKDTEHTELLPWTCLPTSNNLFTLSRVPGGEYSVHVVLASSSDTQLQYSTSMQKLTLSIRPAVEFIPTYEWRPLHAWHTIPSGIETRLPIGVGARKEARLPEPWRLQLSMPSPCKYFLRMDVRRHTSVAEILQKAAERCKYPAKCFQLQVNGEAVSDLQQTVDSTNLFSASKHLLFDDVCLNEALAHETVQAPHLAAAAKDEEVTEI